MFLDCFGKCGARQDRPESIADTAHTELPFYPIPIQADQPAGPIQADQPVGPIRADQPAGPIHAGQAAGALGNVHVAPVDAHAAPADPLHAVHDTLRTTLSHIIDSSEFADFLKRVTHSEEIFVDELEKIQPMLVQAIQNKTIDTLQGWVDLGVEVSNQLNGGLAPGDSGTEFLRTLLASTGVQDSFEERGTADAFAARQRLREDAWSDMTQTMSKEVALMGFMAELASVPSLVRNLQLDDVVDSLANNAQRREQFTGDVNIAKRFQLEPDIDGPLLREYLAAVKEPLDADIPAYNRSAENLPGLISTALKSMPTEAIKTFSECVHGDNSHLAIAVNDELRESIKGLVPTPEQCVHLDNTVLLDMVNTRARADELSDAAADLRDFCLNNLDWESEEINQQDLSRMDGGLETLRIHQLRTMQRTFEQSNAIVDLDLKADAQGGLSYDDAQRILEQTTQIFETERRFVMGSNVSAAVLVQILENYNQTEQANEVSQRMQRLQTAIGHIEHA